jgi:hypothetical protein
LQSPNATPDEVATVARLLKRKIERCRSIIPDCEPHVFIDIDDREDGETLEDIRL